MRSCVWLTLAVAAGWAPIAWYANRMYGSAGILSATVAAVVCLAGALAALVLSALVQGPQAAMLRLALGMAFRMGVPLMGGVLLSQSPRLASGGVFGMMVVFYLITLAVETPLSLRFIDRDSAGRPAVAGQQQEAV